MRNAAFSRLLILLGAALVAVAVAACSGGDDDDDTQPTVSPTIAATSTGEPTSGPTATATSTVASSATPTYAPGVLIDGYIGEATMDEDGTISLALRAASPDGSIVYGYFDYPPDHANYQMILDHVGPIEPGETVNVLPFD